MPNVEWTTVQPGDGWIRIAARLGRSDWAAIQRQNSHIAVPQPGMIVYGGVQ